MYSPHHLSSLVNVVTDQITDEVERKDNRTNDPIEIARNRAVLEKVNETIDNALRELNEVSTSKVAQDAASDAKIHVPPRFSNSGALNVQFHSQTVASNTVLPSFEKQLEEFSKIEGFLNSGREEAMQLKAMTETALPIMDGLNEMLKRPYLNEYNALLNVSPIVGVSGRAIKYLRKGASQSGDKVVNNTWTHFDYLPKEFDPATEKINMFPYNGSFYLSIGRALWRKLPRAMDDNRRKEASKDWSKLFEENWIPVGDACLPSPNVLSVSPYCSNLSANGSAEFSLYIVNEDGTMFTFKGNDLRNNVEFRPVSLTDDQIKAGEKMPKWTKLAYYAGKLFGIDDQCKSWNISIKSANEIEIANPRPQPECIGLSANEEGLVVLRKDGHLYQRSVDIAIDDNYPQHEAKAWKQYVASTDITNIGVASPGCMLDMRTLISSVKDQYMQTQLALWPLVKKVKEYAVLHRSYLDNLRDAQEEIKRAKSQKEIDEIKKNAVDDSIEFAKSSATMLANASRNAQATVVSMTSTLKGVDTDLEAIKAKLQTELEGFQKVLTSQKKDLETIRSIKMWSTIAAIVCVFGMLLLGFTGWGSVVLGALFVTAFVVEQIAESQEDSKIREISKTEGRINHLNQQIKDISELKSGIDKLVLQYNELNKFWGRMVEGSDRVIEFDNKIVDEAFNRLIRSIQLKSSQTDTDILGFGAQAYLDMLYAQGLYIPDPKKLPVKKPVKLPDLDSLQASSFMMMHQSVEVIAPQNLDTENCEVSDVSLPEALEQRQVEPSERKNESNLDIELNQQQHQSDQTQSITITFYIPDEADLIIEAAFDEQANLAREAMESKDFKAGLLHLKKASIMSEMNLLHREEMLLRSGEWFDIDQIKSALTVFYTGELRQLFHEAGEQLPAGALPGGVHLLKAKRLSSEVIQGTMTLANLMTEWSDRHSKRRTKEEKALEAAPYVQCAVQACQELEMITAELNNTFTDINHAVTNAQLKMESKIKEVEIDIDAIDDAAWSSLEGLKDKVPFWTRLSGIEAVMDWVSKAADEIERARELRTQPIRDEVARMRRLLNSGHVYKDQHFTWMGLVQQISLKIGRVLQTLSEIESQLNYGVEFTAKAIMNVSWPALQENSSAVLTLLGVEYAPTVSFSGLLTAGAEMSFMAVSKMETNGATVAKSAKIRGLKEFLNHGLGAHPVVLSEIRDDTQDAETFFKKISGILSIPDVEKLRASDEGNSVWSLRDSANQALQKFVDACILKRKALAELKTVARQQPMRIQMLHSGEVDWEEFYMETNSAFLDAIKVAGKAHDVLESRHVEFQKMLKAIKQNRAAFEAKIKPIDEAIAAKVKKVDEFIFQRAADAATMLFIGVTAGLAIVAGPKVAFDAASNAYSAVSGNVEGYSVSNTFKTFYSEMNWKEFADSMISLGGARKAAVNAVDGLEAISEVFDESVKCGSSMLSHLREMQNRLRDFHEKRLEALLTSRNYKVSQSLKDADIEKAATELSEKQLTELVKSWEDLTDVCTAWIDGYNQHGVSYN
ncbi:hypothetical protein TrVFT333_009407 [Trichoderma virens FT-333]|nr:hypothetical protein TrVFT333_009407 [Trichoderma virens FT-333]